MDLPDLLEAKREEIQRIAARYGAYNVRIFGSVVHGAAGPDSDVDFLVDLEPDRGLLDLGGLWTALQDLLGREVDVVSEDMLHWYIRDRVLAEAVPLEGFRPGLKGEADRMPAKDDMLYLLHISEAIAAIEEFVVDGREVFMTSRLVRDATLRNMQTLAESTQKLSDSAKNEHPEVDWSRISGFRNVLVHDYLSIDLERVWDVIENHLPLLKRAVQAMMEEAESQE